MAVWPIIIRFPNPNHLGSKRGAIAYNQLDLSSYLPANNVTALIKRSKPAHTGESQSMTGEPNLLCYPTEGKCSSTSRTFFGAVL